MVRTVERARPRGAPNPSAAWPTVASPRPPTYWRSASSWSPMVFAFIRIPLLDDSCSQDSLDYSCRQEGIRKFFRGVSLPDEDEVKGDALAVPLAGGVEPDLDQGAGGAVAALPET